MPGVGAELLIHENDLTGLSAKLFLKWNTFSANRERGFAIDEGLSGNFFMSSCVHVDMKIVLL